MDRANIFCISLENGAFDCVYTEQEKIMNKVRLFVSIVIVAMIFGFAGFNPADVPVASASSVTVFAANFDSGVPSEFSGVTATEGVQGYAGLGTGLSVFGGDFLRNDNVSAAKTTLTLSGLPPHTSISLGFLLAIIDSWDGTPCHAGPDSFNVTVDGVSIFSWVFDNSNGNCGSQTYVPPVDVELAREIQLGFTSENIYHRDSAYDMGLDPTFQNIPHTSSTLTIEWFASGPLWQGGTDESWAIDNVVVLVDNVAPTADAGGPYLVAVDQQVTFDGSGSSDPDGDSLTETWTAGGGAVSGSTYTAGNVAGIYEVELVVDDTKENSQPDTTMVVVYDPSGGFVTGGGWIDSAGSGCLQLCVGAEGKANFGFVAKYKKGASVPTGNTEFQFKAGDLNFHSDTYQWLVVNQGGANAQYKGDGTINGDLAPNGEVYKFMLWAGDGDPGGDDTFRIRIWYEEGDNENVVYDNGVDQVIGGGNIKVHSE
jgi:hypothetical protein